MFKGPSEDSGKLGVASGVIYVTGRYRSKMGSFRS